MKYTTKQLFKLEKEIIQKYKGLHSVKPRRIKIVTTDDYIGRATLKALEIDRVFLKTCMRDELIDLLKHEIVHYKYKNEGHSAKFIQYCKKIGSSVGHYELNSWLEECRLDGRISQTLQPNGEIKIKYSSCPRFEVFYSDALYNCTHGGELFKCLRKRYGKSRKEVAKSLGVSEYGIRKFEGRKNLEHADSLDESYAIKIGKSKDPTYDKQFLRRVFKAITERKNVRQHV